MKKSMLALVGIVSIAVVTLFSSCSKDGNDIISENTGINSVTSKALSNNSYVKEFYPHFKWRSLISQSTPCDAASGLFCGFDTDDVLNGDETCWLMMQENDPFRFILPTSFLLANKAKELVDSAALGAMTFHSDFEILSEEIRKLTGTDMIPAGRYKTTLTTYEGESVVCVYLDATL